MLKLFIVVALVLTQVGCTGNESKIAAEITAVGTQHA